MQLLLGIAAMVAAALLHFNLFRWMILAVTIGFVLAAELFNTCLEHVVDLVEPESHPVARAAKHAGAGAVLVVSLMAIVVAVYLYGGALLSK